MASADERARASAFIELARKAIDPEPSAQLNEGKLIREGWHGELDRLRGLKTHAHELLEAYLAEERAATGLTGLRVKYNRILGYYLELSKNAAQALRGILYAAKASLTANAIRPNGLRASSPILTALPSASSSLNTNCS
jgi:DNA mismatch repair protein MutS